MSTAEIRQKIHNYLEIAGDKKVKAIYTMMEAEIEEAEIEYSSEFKEDLDQRYSNYKKGITKPISAEESKKRIQKILDSKRK